MRRIGSTARSRPYQRRRRGPVIAVVTVLAAAALVTWTSVLVNASGPAQDRACPTPVANPVPGEVLPADALNGVAPIPPASVRVRVLNAGGQRGQANLVAAQFGDLGFAEAAPPDNDPYFPGGDMECVGQVRFGPAGESGASTVALLLPCGAGGQTLRSDNGTRRTMRIVVAVSGQRVSLDALQRDHPALALPEDVLAIAATPATRTER